MMRGGAARSVGAAVRRSAVVLACAGTLPLHTLAAQTPPGMPPGHQHHHTPGDTSAGALFLHGRPEAYLLADHLRRGGLLVFMRHARTATTQTDVLPPDFTSCRRQRNLAPSARVTMREIAASWLALGIRATSVESSRFCRATATAAALARGSAVRINDSLVVAPPAVGAGARLVELLATRQPAIGGNTLLVGHIMSPLQAFGIRLQEGEMLVVQPSTGGTPPAVLGRIAAVEWGDVHRDTRAYGAAAVTAAARAQLRASGDSLHQHAPR
jgi:phosphohistidine phosphatase SixA